MYVPHLHPFICRWTLRLCPCLGCCEYHCHDDRSLLMRQTGGADIYQHATRSKCFLHTTSRGRGCCQYLRCTVWFQCLSRVTQLDGEASRPWPYSCQDRAIGQPCPPGATRLVSGSLIPGGLLTPDPGSLHSRPGSCHLRVWTSLLHSPGPPKAAKGQPARAPSWVCWAEQPRWAAPALCFLPQTSSWRQKPLGARGRSVNLAGFREPVPRGGKTGRAGQYLVAEAPRAHCHPWGPLESRLQNQSSELPSRSSSAPAALTLRNCEPLNWLSNIIGELLVREKV